MFIIKINKLKIYAKIGVSDQERKKKQPLLVSLKFSYKVSENKNVNDIKKLSESNILFGNIILENLEAMGVKTFINFSTVWENFNGKKENYYNLYSAYKASFRNIINFYKKKFIKTKFLNLVVSDTFGLNDKRKKIINLLKINYKKNLLTKVISKNLYINLLNIIDIKNAVRLVLKRNYKSDTYLLQNKKDFKISDIIKGINKYSDKKIRIKWLLLKKIL